MPSLSRRRFLQSLSRPASRTFLQRLFRGRGSPESEAEDQAPAPAERPAITLTQEELDRRSRPRQIGARPSGRKPAGRGTAQAA